ncbi:MAG: DMT family transporter [Rhizobacter sp.]
MKSSKSKLTVRAIAYWMSGASLIIGMQTAAKLAAQYGYSVRHSMTARYIGGLMLGLLLMWVVNRSMRSIRSANWKLQTQRSVAVVVITFGLFVSNQWIGLGLTTAFTYSWPALCLIVGWQRWLGFDEKPDFRSAVSVLITFIGVGMLVRLGLHPAAGSPHLPAVAIGTCAVLLAGLCTGYQVNITPKIKVVDPDPFTGLVWMMFIGVLGIGMWDAGAWFMPAARAPQLVFSTASVVVALAIPVCGTVAQYLYILAQAEAPTRLLTPLTSLVQLPLALVVGHFAFREAWPIFEEALWMSVIFAGSLLNYLPMPNSGPPTSPKGAN